jgi:hypothetical protein
MKPKKSLTAEAHKAPIRKRTRQGAGKGSKPKRGQKAYRGQGR